MPRRKPSTSTTTTTSRVIGYARVSTEAQAREGVSLEAQEARVKGWAESHGFEFAGMHVDAGISGKKMSNRPALTAALEALRPGDALVVYSLSRLARSTRDTLDIADMLEGKDAHLVSLSESIDTTSAAGRMIFRMLAVLAEFERDVISERTTTALTQVRAQGRKTGGDVPYGFMLAADGATLVPNARERAVIDLSRELHAAGWSLRKIGAELTARGYLNRKGNPFHASTISNLLAA